MRAVIFKSAKPLIKIAGGASTQRVGVINKTKINYFVIYISVSRDLHSQRCCLFTHAGTNTKNHIKGYTTPDVSHDLHLPSRKIGPIFHHYSLIQPFNYTVARDGNVARKKSRIDGDVSGRPSRPIVATRRRQTYGFIIRIYNCTSTIYCNPNFNIIETHHPVKYFQHSPPQNNPVSGETGEISSYNLINFNIYKAPCVERAVV